MIYLGSRRRPGTRVLCVIILFVITAFPAAGQNIDKGRKQTDEHIKQCTERHGYNPETASSLGPHELGAGEREWRECVYAGVEKYVIPNTLSPDAYRKAIAEDREMTASVAAGKITRVERKARVQKLLDEMDRLEKANKAKIERQKEAASRLVQQEMQRQLDVTRRSMMGPLGR